jgi:hypothetical protein
MIEKSNSTSLALATIAILGQPYMDAHFFAKPSIYDFQKVKIAAIHPDFK